MKSSQTVVSVVIPARDVADWIGACLDSLLEQEHHAWQALVVENCSRDNTAAIVKSYADPRVMLVVSKESGVSRARNLGLSLVTSDVVLFLDSDDMLHPTALSRLVAALDADPDVIAAYGTYRMIDEQGGSLGGGIILPQSPPPTSELLKALLRSNFFANGGHIAIRKAALERIALFDSNITLGEDWVVWVRLAALGPFRFVGAEPEILLFRQRQVSAFRRLARDVKNFQPCLDAIHADASIIGAIPPKQLAQMRRISEAECLWVSGRENFRHGEKRTGVSLMLRSLAAHPDRRRAVLAAIALFAPRLAGRVSGELTPYNFPRLGN